MTPWCGFTIRPRQQVGARFGGADASPITLVTGRIQLNILKHPALLGLLALASAGMLAVVGSSAAAATGVPLGTAGDFAVLAGSGRWRRG